jgi:hypothetical protein
MAWFRERSQKGGAAIDIYYITKIGKADWEVLEA